MTYFHWSYVAVQSPCSITNVICTVEEAGASLTSASMALYDQDQSFVGQTADLSTAFESAGIITAALTGGPFAVTGPGVFVAVAAAGTTAPYLSAIYPYNGYNLYLRNVGDAGLFGRDGATPWPSTLPATADNTSDWYFFAVS